MPYHERYGQVCPHCDVNCTCGQPGDVGGPAIDGGYAYYDGQHVYWDYHKDGHHKINIFPNGGPNIHGHDHIIVRDGRVELIGGNNHIMGGYEVFRRINGVLIIDTER